MDSIPRFSPDGTRIVYISDRSGAPEVWTAGVDGGNQSQLTDLRATVTGSPSWSRDGSHIIFDSNRSGHFRIYSVSAAGGTPTSLTSDSCDNAVASYSNDGRWIYFTSNRTGVFQIWKMAADRQRAIQVTKKGGRVAFESADGRFLYYATTVIDSKQNAVWRVPVEGGDELPVIAGVHPFSFGLSRDGIYFNPSTPGRESSSIDFFSFASQSVSRLMLLNRPSRQGVSVSPDGRYLLFTQDDYVGADLMIVDNLR
jgi:Tol biopolymer transport system component